MVKVLVTLDDHLLERLDQEAAARGLTRSALLARMAAAALGEPIGPGARTEAHQALDRLKTLFGDAADPLDPTQIIRQMRDSR